MLTAEIKNRIVAEAERHERMDGAMFAKGSYEKRNGVVKHCSIGCVWASLGQDASEGNHGKLSAPTGVPELILRLSDHVFEALPDADSATWTRRLWSAIPDGIDLAPHSAEVVARLFLDPEIGLAYTAILDSVKSCAREIGELYHRRANGNEPSDDAWHAAWQQAYTARQQAYTARQQADAAWRQADAAWQQAYTAWRQAYAERQQFWIRVAAVMIDVLSNWTPAA